MRLVLTAVLWALNSNINVIGKKAMFLCIKSAAGFHGGSPSGLCALQGAISGHH